MAQLHLDEADAIEIEQIIGRAQDVIDAIEAELEATCSHPGRPPDWTVRGLLTAFLLLAAHTPTFHIDKLEPLIATLPEATRTRLELNRPDRKPFTTRQFSYGWNRICQAIDPGTPGLDPEEKARRVGLCEVLFNDLVWASVPPDVRRDWKGDVAVDATLVWSFGRPARKGNEKLYANGTDGDGTPTSVRYHEPLYDETGAAVHPYIERLIPNQVKPAQTPSGRKKRKDWKRKPVGADWIGNRSGMKVVHGYAHHVAVACGPELQAAGVPDLAVGLITAPAPTAPAPVGISIARDIARRRTADPATAGERPLVDVLADGGYTGAKAENWTLPIRQLGAEPILRLHGTNQEGHRATLHDRGILLIDGRYYCECLPQELRVAAYPHRPTHDRNVNIRRKTDYRKVLARRAAFELACIGTYRTDKGLRFASPHAGRCELCAGTDHECCTTKTLSIGWADLGAYQKHRFGSEDWEDSYARRNRVEGFFGVLKDTSGTGHNRLVGRFFDFAKTAFVFACKTVATNLRMIRAWADDRTRAKAEAKAEARARTKRGRPTELPTLDDVVADPTLIAATKKAKVRRRKRKRTPPNGRAPDNPFGNLAD